MTSSPKSARNATITIWLLCLVAVWPIGWWMPLGAVIGVAILALLYGTIFGIMDNSRIMFYMSVTWIIAMGIAYMIAHRIYPVVRFQHF